MIYVLSSALWSRREGGLCLLTLLNYKLRGLNSRLSLALVLLTQF